ncbi:uncharacterized protein JN550_005891 [Neoarthrinium moseri]|uniref:uncharacterized protein n=1 Tax=Neoarthrinium moseri TaxID=1658444 RepID=UPI001FDD8883|nr:uncharacterized protein JN550_005891 [Neoarthrinium moseri]KAI1869261.1 hypothetical protein JN550_005891 [Neoarthrinium moseri]
MEYAESLSPWGWLSVLGQATGITFRLVFKAGRALLTRGTHGLSLHEYIAYVGMRDYQSGLSAVAIQNLLPSTSKTCSRFANKHGIPFEVIQLPDATIANRLGPPSAKNVVMFFHGGGYMAPALSEHASFAFGYGEYSTRDVAVYFLQYDLASEHANHYPRQLQQAVSLLNHLTSSKQIPPGSITLVGDSAGAHLLLSLLLHLKHPNPQVPQVEMNTPLGGAVLVSPWVQLQSSATSLETNKQEDILSTPSLAYWAKNFLGDAAPDAWNSPLTAPLEWWDDLPVKRILVTYGDKELLRDDAGKLCEILREHHAETTALAFPGELHVHMVMNRFLLIRKPCESERAYVKWMRDQIDGAPTSDGPAVVGVADQTV